MLIVNVLPKPIKPKFWRVVAMWGIMGRTSVLLARKT
jgi:hypothetical protein